MHLATTRFYETTVTKRFQLGEGSTKQISDTPYERYTYESATTIYNVDRRKSDGNKTYHINGGFATESNRFFKAIEKHFSI